MNPLALRHCVGSLLLGALFALAAPLAPAQPTRDPAPVAAAFPPLVSREEAVVVSIRTDGAGLGLDDSEVGPMPGDQQDAISQTRDAGSGSRPEERALASGFVISTEGYILTNAHVVIGAEQVTVRLADKREFSARLIGFDRRTDVGLIKIDAAGLIAARIGDPSRLEVGEWVVAIGAPFGFESSLTAGIVSARPRFLPNGGGVPMIQTDVAINPGSSGGPLFNLRGEVVGINSMIVTESGTYVGVSLTLPIDVAMKVAAELRDHGYVVRSQLGAQLQELTPELARSFGRSSANGALVVRVMPGGPADRAGLRAGDIVLGAGNAVDVPHAEVQQSIAAAPPGQVLPLNVWRRAEVRRIPVMPVAVPPETVPRPPPPEPADRRLGLSIVELGAAQRAMLHVDGGIEVRGAGGAARRAGVRSGDVILAVNDVSVANVAGFEAALASVARRQPVALLVLRGSSLGYVAVPLSD